MNSKVSKRAEIRAYVCLAIAMGITFICIESIPTEYRQFYGVGCMVGSIALYVFFQAKGWIGKRDAQDAWVYLGCILFGFLVFWWLVLIVGYNRLVLPRLEARKNDSMA